MLRSFILKSSLITGFIILFLITFELALAVMAPFRPGNFFFPLQDFAEQKVFIIYPDPINRSNYALDLMERRIIDLNDRAGSKFELIALEFLDKAVDQATLAISQVPDDQSSDLRLRLLYLAQQANDTLNSLVLLQDENLSTFQTFLTKIQTLMLMVDKNGVSNKELTRVSGITIGEKTSDGNPTTASAITSGLIEFPPGSPGAVHAFYPLVGQHALLSCKDCHRSGKYVGTPNTCTLCHILARPAPHYNGDCVSCHTAIAWEDIHFDHEKYGAVDCKSCHENQTPANHYSGQCSACHQTKAWNIVTFNHAVAGAVDCASCHNKDVPNNHYSGQCSNCHNTSGWIFVTFNHVGLAIVYLAIPRMLPKIIIAGNVHPVIQPSHGRVRSSHTMV